MLINCRSCGVSFEAGTNDHIFSTEHQNNISIIKIGSSQKTEDAERWIEFMRSTRKQFKKLDKIIEPRKDEYIPIR